jgi:hypothetical protein
VSPASIGLAWRPQTTVEIAANDAEQLIKLVELLEEDDDVQTVWGNYEVSEEVMERLARWHASSSHNPLPESEWPTICVVFVPPSHPGLTALKGGAC